MAEGALDFLRLLATRRRRQIGAAGVTGTESSAGGDGEAGAQLAVVQQVRGCHSSS